MVKVVSKMTPRARHSAIWLRLRERHHVRTYVPFGTLVPELITLTISPSKMREKW